MFASFIVRASALACACVVVSGCAVGPRIYAGNLADANVAQQDAFNQVLLLNVLRSRDRQPRAYSHFTALRGSADVSTNIGVAAGFGPHASSLPSNVGAGASGSLGISDDMAPQDDQDFYRGILTPISYDTWSLYQDQNWPSDLLFHVFVEQIRVPTADYQSVKSAVATICKSAPADRTVSSDCEGIAARASLSGCDKPWPQDVSGEEFVVLDNDASDVCERAFFESFTFSLGVLGFHIEHASSSQVGPVIPAKTFEKDLTWTAALKDGNYDLEPVKDKKGAVIGYALNQGGGYSARLRNYHETPGAVAGANVVIAAKSDAAGVATAAKGLKILITPRSTDAMVYYLGEAVRAAAAGKPPVMIRKSGGEIPLITVREGCTDDDAVCVAYRNKRFSVPNEDNSDAMQSFELLKQVFALYNKGSVPSTTAVTIVP